MSLLSVLIPVHNYNASQLVADFLQLAEREQVDIEIIVADDASSKDITKSELYPINERVTYIRYDINQGRARIRNLLAEAAHSPWLLFVDCDAALTPEFSLKNYIPASSSPVVCGGFRHPEVNPCPEATLRYKYERAADRLRSATIRSQHPYAQLSTFSLLIQRELFLSIRFDDSCTDYGYEDTLFGAELQRRSIPIDHIDNPLLHLGLESNERYLQKTETALRTLHRLAPKMKDHSRLLAIVTRLRRFHLTLPIRFLYLILYPLLRHNLLSRHPLLPCFAFYKLGFYLCLNQNRS